MSDELDRFRRAAEHYCEVVDECDELTLHAFLSRLNVVLPEVYLSASGLSDRFEDGPDMPDEFGADEEGEVRDRVRSKLGGNDEYRAIYDPWDPADEAIARSLANDVAEIYRDLRNVLADARRTQAAVWGWRFRFSHLWGRDAVTVMTALYGLLHDPEHMVYED